MNKYLILPQVTVCMGNKVRSLGLHRGKQGGGAAPWFELLCIPSSAPSDGLRVSFIFKRPPFRDFARNGLALNAAQPAAQPKAILGRVWETPGLTRHKV